MDDTDINFALFDVKKLKKAVEDVKADPHLSRSTLKKLDIDIAVRMGKHEAITKILIPLTEAYHTDRRRKDRSYDPEKDYVFKSTHKVTLGECDRLMDEVDKLRAIRSKVTNAVIARMHITNYAQEFLKILNLIAPDKERKHYEQTEAPNGAGE